MILNIGCTKMLLFMFTSDSGQGIIACFYPTNLFKDVFIILLVPNDFWHDSDTSPARAKVVVNLISIQVTVVVHKFSSKVF